MDPGDGSIQGVRALGYVGGVSQWRVFMRTLRPQVAADPVVRFETAPGEQLPIDWVEFRKGADPLYAFCATLGYSRASYVEFVSDMKVSTLVDGHPHAFEALGGVARRLLYDNMKTVVLERDVAGSGEHRYHAGFLDYARHGGFVIKLCRPYRARTKGKVERFNGTLRRSFYVPLLSRLKPVGLPLDAVTANAEVRRWLAEVANVRIHAGTPMPPAQRLQEERAHLPGIPPPWRGDIGAARPLDTPQPPVEEGTVRPTVAERIALPTLKQHPLTVYAQRLTQLQRDVEMPP